MKKALALLGTIIFVFSIVPMGAFATDGDYSDHTSNIAPYVDTIIRGFTDSNNVLRHTLHIDDVELWQEGLPLGIYQLTANVPADCDVIDIDLYFDAADLMTDQYYQLFDIYITGLVNIDYIEFYQHTTYRSFPIYYATYHQHRLYVMTAGNVLASGSYTIRVHIKRGGFTVSYYNDILPYCYLRELTDLTTTETLTQWYFLTSLLRELDTLEFNISNITVDMTNLNTAISSCESILRGMRYGYTRYLNVSDDTSVQIGRIVPLNSSGSPTGSAKNLYSNTTGTFSVSSSFCVLLKFVSGSYNYPYLNLLIPVTHIPANFSIMKFTVEYGFSTSFSNYYYNNTRFDGIYNNYCSYYTKHNYNKDFLCIRMYAPIYYFDQQSVLLVRFLTDDSFASSLDFDCNISASTDSFYMFNFSDASQRGYEDTHLMYLDKIYNLLGEISDNNLSYPAGPSDPQDPNQTTNIYDVNIEFNTQVGDISVFENTYSQQLPTYDQSISDQYLVPVSNSYDFSDLNSTFNSIWSSSFQYDTDEEDNIVGVYGIGLYFIIPLVLLVLFALFRRVTS